MCSEGRWKERASAAASRPMSESTLFQRPPLGFHENIATSSFNHPSPKSAYNWQPTTSEVLCWEEQRTEITGTQTLMKVRRWVAHSWYSGFVSWSPQTPRLLPSHYPTDVASITRYHMVQVGCSSLRHDIKIFSRKERWRTNKKMEGVGHMVISVIFWGRFPWAAF